MATTTYPVAASFPAGVALAQLSTELESVWPADLFPPGTMEDGLLMLVRGGAPARNGVITNGNLEIETTRDLTTQENSDAIAHFLTHVPVFAEEIPNVADLAAGSYTGQTQYVRDVPRQGGGSGVICYWSEGDRTWRRMRDDVVVTTIS